MCDTNASPFTEHTGVIMQYMLMLQKILLCRMKHIMLQEMFIELKVSIRFYGIVAFILFYYH